MPLIKRLVEPVHISRAIVPTHINNELEFVGNSSLAHIMRQLGTLSTHADDLFAELHRDAASLLYRVSQLSERVERVQARIAELNPIVEEVSLHDINLRKPFKSSVIKEQQVITQATRPPSVMLIYQHCCEPPPALRILNQFREDGRDSLKFYTDPGYFLELWCLEIAKDTENQMKRHKQRGRRNARPGKEPRSIRMPKPQHGNYSDMRHGPEFVENYRREHMVGRQSTMAEQRSPKVELYRTGSLQQHVPALPRWNTANATVLPTEAAAYPANLPGHPAAYTHGYDRLAAGHVPAVERGHPSPSAQPMRSASLRQPAVNYTVSLADSRMSPGIGPYPTRTSPPVCAAGYIGHGDADFSLGGEPIAQQKVLRDSFELPAPPSPLNVSVVQSSSMNDKLPSPPHLATPPLETERQLHARSSPQALPSPSLPVSAPYVDGKAGEIPAAWYGANVTNALSSQSQLDNNSDTSSLATGQQTDDGLRPDQPPLVRDTRSDLLAAIREGIQLRKVEERRQKTAQKQQQHAPGAGGGGTAGGRLDVQAIMEAAFEMRRKALEENDSEDDDDADGRWSDND